MSDFSELKRKSGRKGLEIQQKEAERLASGGSNREEDDRFWSPTVDKTGNGFAVIRFLPPPKGEELPWVRIWNHGFKGPGGWYIENSLTTIGKDDPLGEYNSRLWDSGSDADKDTVRKQKRRLTYFSNIYIVRDPANPSNEGQVFLFRYGKKIFDKINDMMHPQFEDEEAISPFDFWEGADFKMKIRQVEGYRNYDKSEFDSPAPLFDDDAMLEDIWNKQYSLQELIADKNFKSYNELKVKLVKVLGFDPFVPKGSSMQSPIETPKQQSISKPVTAEDISNSYTNTNSSVDQEEDDESMSYFARLAEEEA